MLGKLQKVRIDRPLLLKLIGIAEDHEAWCLEECTQLRETDHPHAELYSLRAAKARKTIDKVQIVLGSGL